VGGVRLRPKISLKDFVTIHQNLGDSGLMDWGRNAESDKEGGVYKKSQKLGPQERKIRFLIGRNNRKMVWLIFSHENKIIRGRGDGFKYDVQFMSN